MLVDRLGAVALASQRLARKRRRIREPRRVDEDFARRFGDARGVVPNGPKVVGAGDEGSTARQGPYATIGEVEARGVCEMRGRKLSKCEREGERGKAAHQWRPFLTMA